MKFFFVILVILMNLFGENTIKEFYKDCMKPKNMRKQYTREERIKRDQPQKLTKEEIEENDKLEKSLFDIQIIETQTKKVAIIKNKSYCHVILNLGVFKNEELKDFTQEIELKEKEEVKITKIK